MQIKGKISIKGIVQGVGFRPFVYKTAQDLGMHGTVRNLGSEVRVHAEGTNFEEFVRRLSSGTPLSRIDSVTVTDSDEPVPAEFVILESAAGTLSGFIPADVATCDECIKDIFTRGGRYEGYWATSCVNCGPRYSIICALPYDRERTRMDAFPMCGACEGEYTDPASRRHHAQTIACADCGPKLSLLHPDGTTVPGEPLHTAASLLDNGAVVAIRGLGGFHIACTAEAAGRLKGALGRPEQPLAVMATADEIRRVARISPAEWELLNGPAHPIVVLPKKNPQALNDISKLHTIGCMLPYTALHHLLFAHLTNPMLVMTSANAPGYPMITDTREACERLGGHVDYILTHNRVIQNRCDDSVVRDGKIIRLSRGLAPKRERCDLGDACILGTGPELNANISIYQGGFCVTSPHVGNVRNPPTLAYLKETVERTAHLLGAGFDVIAHDLHPQFLSTRYAQELAEETGATLVPVQHHKAHIAAANPGPCIGIAIDGVGYGEDGTVWGGEVFAGAVPDFTRVGHLEPVMMPGGDLATRYPERMLYGILPEEETADLLASRGWDATTLGVLQKQVERQFNITISSSTGRVLDAAAALLGVCRERTFDGEPAQVLETTAIPGTASLWEREFIQEQGRTILSTSALLREAFSRMKTEQTADIAASFQQTLATGIAEIAVMAAEERQYKKIALSGGVAYNQAIESAIRKTVVASGHEYILNTDYPLGDGCISYGQCVWAGTTLKQGK
ncbi:carbamoyltransferase HypF [Methanogenium organophilum]|uniref:Carbamoyltransferase n=1 Tax=Methanogenium organophilum TaxID=2199 RepID=A0A9X9S5K7_METOG|nr:carbamoyltransferase HypF [Methanogenium organophilum]WAI02086.1 carbamoyltransferase HypF [Methanogenium organophilum]